MAKLDLEPIKKLDLKPVKKLELESIPQEKVIPQLQEARPLPQTIFENIVVQSKRKPAALLKGIGGDIPFSVSRQVTKEFTPASGLEKGLMGVPRFARDIAITSKIAPLRGLKLLGAAGLFGATTAGTEEPKEIAKSAGKEAALFGTIAVGAKSLPYGGKIIQKGFEKVPPFLEKIIRKIPVKSILGINKEALARLPVAIQERMLRAGEFIGVSLKKIGNVARLKFKRYTDIQLAKIEGEKFAQGLEQTLSKEEREVIPFLIEKTGIPRKLQKPELIATVRNPEKRKILQSFANQIKGKYDDFHANLIEVYGDDIGFVKDYINRLWDLKGTTQKQKDKIFNWFMTRPKHLKPRLINTIQEGVNKFGLKPKTLDAAQLYRYYNNNVTTAMANMSFLKGVNKIKTPEGLNMIMRADRAPKEWRTIDHPVLRRAIGHKVKGGSEESLMIGKIPVKVHPEIVDEIDAMFGEGARGFTGNVARSIEGINAFAKYSQLTLSMFHAVALAESAVANSSLNPKLMVNVIRGMKKGEKPILNDPLIKEWIPHGLGVSVPTDIPRNLVESSLKAAENNLSKGFMGRLLKNIAVKPVRKAVEFNNRFLWDYYHPQLKVFTANRLYKDLLKNPNFRNVPEGQLRKSVAQWVNDSYGGQAWDLMTKSRKWIQGAHYLLLSPDWAVSTIRQALAPFQFGGRSKIDAAIRGELGSNFWKAGAMTLFASINHLNRAFSKLYLGEERDIWENDPGHQTHLFLGFNPDGSKRWLRWGKQFRELPEFFIRNEQWQPLGAPIDKIAGKLSPLIRAGMEQARPFQFGELAKAKGTKRETIERLKALGTFPIPFSIQQQFRRGEFSPLFFAFPVSGTRGSAYYNFLRQAQEAVRDNNTSRLETIYRSAVENGIDADDLMRKAKKDVEYEELQVKKNADEVYETLLTLPREAWKPYIDSQNLDEGTKKRLRFFVRKRLKAETLMEKIKTEGFTKNRIKELIKQ